LRLWHLNESLKLLRRLFLVLLIRIAIPNVELKLENLGFFF
jgi:hypothetical protein